MCSRRRQAEVHDTIYNKEWGIKAVSPVTLRAVNNFRSFASILKRAGAEARARPIPITVAAVLFQHILEQQLCKKRCDTSCCIDILCKIAFLSAHAEYVHDVSLHLSLHLPRPSLTLTRARSPSISHSVLSFLALLSSPFPSLRSPSLAPALHRTAPRRRSSSCSYIKPYVIFHHITKRRSSSWAAPRSRWRSRSRTTTGWPSSTPWRPPPAP